MTGYKPSGYNSLSAYLIADEAQQLVDQLTSLFDATVKRVYHREDGKIAHLELLIDDTILMISNSTSQYAATKSTLHLYVPDVQFIFDRVRKAGLPVLEEPVNQPGDPDVRGAFSDLAGNYWAVSTQLQA